MKQHRWGWGIVGLVAWIATATAGEALLWDFPRASEPQPASFRLIYRNSNDPGGVLQQFGVPWHPREACGSLLPEGDTTPDPFCASLSTYLAPGIYHDVASYCSSRAERRREEQQEEQRRPGRQAWGRSWACQRRDAGGGLPRALEAVGGRAVHLSGAP
jgi:hypothetical protein